MKGRTASSPKGGMNLWGRRLLRHRRPVAALLAALSVAFAVAAVRLPGPAGVRVLVAARDLPAGTALRPGDLRPAVLPATAVPDGTIRARVTGRILAGPMRRGEIITDARTVGSRLLAGYGPDVVATPIRPADPGTVRLLRPGDRVDVLSSDAPADPADPGVSLDDLHPNAPTSHTRAEPEPPDPSAGTSRPPVPPSNGAARARVVATAVPVIAVLREDPGTGEPGGLIMLATTREQSAALTAASGTRLAVALVTTPRTTGAHPPPP
ncbi:SAF domain-containing protein [Thermomonospora cellulosilytica]|uniref:Flp pilus assembly protein CpaB n=1 Tax=Thermomonospora cellulosilytica TaxID=1411118 RepID=A0A7W3R8A7_9ACTN|nr:SAF domain-containing protein [Thermomonospora cellulosilytica]MBA9003481.1 Flp pilus assembly protein CpaB [Thermomonospora cellulosilytica]